MHSNKRMRTYQLLLFLVALFTVGFSACGTSSSALSGSSTSGTNTPTNTLASGTTKAPSQPTSPTSPTKIPVLPTATTIPPTATAVPPTATPIPSQTEIAPTQTQDPTPASFMHGGMSLVDTCVQQRTVDVPGVACSSDLSFSISKPNSQEIISVPFDVHWTVASSTPNVGITPTKGTIPAGKTTTSDTFTISPPDPCETTIFTISSPDITGKMGAYMLCNPELTLNVGDTYSASDAKQGTLSLDTLSPNTVGCGNGDTAGTIACNVTLNRVGSFKGDVAWFTNAGGFSISSSSGTGGMIAQNQMIPIRISGIACNDTALHDVSFDWSEMDSYGGGVTFEWSKTTC